MKSLIFDLDGTLWNTEKSYYYAFTTFLNNHPNYLSQMKIDVVEKLKAITMDKMAPLLFPLETKEIQKQNILECLKYSCEYLTKQDIKESTVNAIKNLSKEFDLYIVSNCPHEYIDIFFKKTNLKAYFKDVVSLGGFTVNDDFDKSNNLKNLVLKHNLSNKDTFFIGDSHLDLDASIYANVNFIYLNDEMDIETAVYQKLEDIQILNLCDSYKEFVYKDARVTILENQKQKEYKHLFGFLHLSKDETNNIQLFKQAFKYVKENNIKEIVGPINYSTWFDYRLPIDNYNIRLIPDINGSEEQIKMLKQLGFKEKYTYASTLARINKRLESISRKNKLGCDYYDELVVGSKVFEYTDEIFELSKKCFEDGYLYSDVPYNTFNNIYMKWLKKLPFDIDLYMIRTKDTKSLVSYGICYFDKLNKMYVCKTAAILKEHQKTNVVMQLAKIVYERTRFHGSEALLFHFQNEQKNTLSAFWRNNVLLKKRYALFIKEFDYENM